MSEANLLRWPINIAKLLTNNKSSGDDYTSNHFQIYFVGVLHPVWSLVIN
ncbi:MAG TPA: hypothetical protein VIP70_05160 [Nitrososphaeraceae archaeon]